MTAVIATVGGATAIAIAVLGWLLRRAHDQVALWRETARRQLRDLEIAIQNRRALEAACNVLRASLKRQSDYLGALAEHYPHLVGDYVRHQLREAERLTDDAQDTGAAAALPEGDGGERSN